jgi:glycosyltransferase involved in cell wall biosynthesis
MQDSQKRAGDAYASPPARAASRRPVIWFEIEDLLRHFDHMPNPTGITRCCLEILTELEKHYGQTGQVKFCRLSLYRSRFEEIGIERLVAAYTDPAGAYAPWHALTWLGTPREEILRGLRTISRVPRYLGRIAKPVLRDVSGSRARWRQFEASLKPGDIIVTLGASWLNSRYADRIAALKRERGIRFVQMIHDVIFVPHPEWFNFIGKQCLPWLERILPVADLVLTVSSHSRKDIRNFAAQRGLALPPIEVLRLGSGFRPHRPQAAAPPTAAPVALPERFALFVATIEARKNHSFLLRVWRRLIEKHGAQAIPQLVLVGRPGWLVIDFMAFRSELVASNFLDGKVTLLSDLSDSDLKRAYDQCLFTVYPSLYEGWGSPVAESLAHGKFCVAADRTSLPEVGGTLIDYFDPTNEDDAVAKIERALFEPGYLAAREAFLRANHRPATWTDCARSLIAIVEEATPAAVSAPRSEGVPDWDSEPEPRWSAP